MELHIENFRSIRDQRLCLSPITVVYGHNGSGKSTLLYALATLKNIILNPNQPSDGFFNYGFANLGGFTAVVFDHNVAEEIRLSVSIKAESSEITYGVSVGEKQGVFDLLLHEKPEAPVRLHLEASFPYAGNKRSQQSFSSAESGFTASWNGLLAEVQAKQQSDLKEARRLAELLNTPLETIRSSVIVPLRRGFSRPHYSSVPLSLQITEDEVATILSTDKYLVSKVSFYLEQIFQRDLRVNVTPGTAVFTLDVTDKRTGVSCELVNEGFGVNQVAYMLTRCLTPQVKWVCIEEPEIHLHPTAVRNLARALASIAKRERKHLLISTHSEAFVLAILALVSRGELKPKDLSFYLANKRGKEASFERQPVNGKGQVQGGLRTFIEAELEDIKGFLKI